MSKKIGFIGLETMRLSMTINLNKAGFEVIGYDAFDGSREGTKAAGITIAATLKEIAGQADDATASVVRGYNQNVEILLGEDGLLSADSEGLTVIVVSVLDLDLMNALGQQVEAAADVKLIATAASGDVTGAQTNTLSTMASGPGGRVNTAHPYFNAASSNTSYYGANSGNNQAAELVNNMMLGITTNGIAEGLKFGEHYNLPREALLNLLKVSAGDGWVAYNWDSASKWIEDTALVVLFKDLKAVHLKGLEYGIMMPFNTLSSTMLFDFWGQRPKAK